MFDQSSFDIRSFDVDAWLFSFRPGIRILSRFKSLGARYIELDSEVGKALSLDSKTGVITPEVKR
jgi:hypothetical protein